MSTRGESSSQVHRDTLPVPMLTGTRFLKIDYTRMHVDYFYSSKIGLTAYYGHDGISNSSGNSATMGASTASFGITESSSSFDHSESYGNVVTSVVIDRTIDPCQSTERACN